MEYFYLFDTKIGKLKITEQDGKITCIGFAKELPPADSIAKTPVLLQSAEQIQEYLSGERRDFTFPVQLKGTAYQMKVWNVLLQIPYGQTWTYRQVAAMAGNEKAARAAGGACHRNPVMIAVPCHRVVGSDKSLTGYAGGLKTKEFLLELERQVETRCCKKGEITL